MTLSSVKSVCRRAMRLALFAAALVCCGVSGVLAASATLQWDPNTEPDVTGYKMHYGVASQNFTTHIDVGNVVSHTLTNLGAGTKYYFAITAYDSFGNESGYSNEVSVSTPAAGGEAVSAPLRPSGPMTGLVGVSYTYTASGSVSSTGDPVQYRFSWSDGSVSPWLPAGVTSATKAWSAPGTYTLVSVEARCSLHTAVVSSSSPALTVTIAAAALETVSSPSAPSGPSNGVVGKAYTYTAGGAVSSAGHSLEYRFSWSDGSVSSWVPAAAASASKTWNAPGNFTLVRTEARCALHPSIVSSPSPSITVVITAGVAESVSQPTAPAGPAGGSTNDLYAFSTGGSASSTGDPVMYRFHWGDGTTSEWVGPGLPVTAGKSWGVPGTYLVQAEAACANHPAVGSFSTAVAVSIVAGSTPATHSSVLWTRGDTGQASLWQVDSATGAAISSVYVGAEAGVGASWQATSYVQPDSGTGYVLWSRSDTGQAMLWKVNPGTGARTSWIYLHSSAGVGAPWQATSYAHVDETTGYVLWTRSDTGQAALWKVNPATGAHVSSVYLLSVKGIGGPWQATSYAHVDATTGYVLWTRSDTGQAALWKVNPSTGSLTSSVYLYTAAGIGGPWRATGFERSSATKGYVVWSRSDTGQAMVWEVNPGLPTGENQRTAWWYLHSWTPTGLAGGPWHASSYLPANNPPTLDVIADVVLPDGSPASVALSGISAGSGEVQAVTVTATSSNPALIPNPTVSYASPAATGSLSLTPVGGASGTASIMVLVGDGQAANGVVKRTFAVTVTEANNAPTDIALRTNPLDGVLPAGTPVGTFDTSDPDAGDTFVYAFASGAGDADNASFRIVGDELRTLVELGFSATSPHSIRVRSTDSGGLATEKSFTVVPPAAHPAYALWSRSDTGQGSLWKIDPATGATISSVNLYRASGVGASWLATSYSHVDEGTGYALWARSDTGQAMLWKVDPGTGALIGWSYLLSQAGVGSPWQATSYAHVNATTGYVLWTRGDTGQAALWRVNPSQVGSGSPVVPTGTSYLFSVAGVGGPWQAGSFSYVDATTAYVLWTRSDTGQAALWKVDPGGVGRLSVIPPLKMAYVSSASGIGAPWQATSYLHVDATTGYVLWTRSDTGRAELSMLDPSGVESLSVIKPSAATTQAVSAGIGKPWLATSYFLSTQ